MKEDNLNLAITAAKGLGHNLNTVYPDTFLK